MGAFILAGIVLLVGIVGFFVIIAAYMSLPAPSVQGDATAPFWWLGSCAVLAVIVSASHWLPHIGW